jgi:NAD-dependent dihydropyrimidine dehydrogenase PreA subunit
MPENKFHSVPRNKIPWYPTIDFEKCVGCGKCVEYCKFGVYEFREKNGKNLPLVTMPNNCVVYCNGCEKICAYSAIKHPSKLETGKIISELRKTLKQKTKSL